MFTEISILAHTAYAQILDNLIAEPISKKTGFNINTKKRQGHAYSYLQVSYGSSRKQIYIGQDSKSLRYLISSQEALWEQGRGYAEINQKYSDMAISGGCMATDRQHHRALTLMEQFGLFESGAVIIGPIVYEISQNVFGVNLNLQNKPENHIDILMTQSQITSSTLKLPVNYFKRGKGTLKPNNSEITWEIREPETSYLTDNHWPAVIFTKNKPPTLVKVPDPARYAIYQLATSSNEKEAAQKMLGFLREVRPGSIDLALIAAEKDSLLQLEVKDLRF